MKEEKRDKNPSVLWPRFKLEISLAFILLITENETR
jgi:hypothetical protein